MGNLVDAQEVWTIMEFMQGGALKKMVTKVVLEELHISYIVKEVLEALVFIHKNFVAHRDIKSHNIMLTVQGDVKLVDFGLALDLRKVGAMHRVGSPLWMAPEVIRNEPQTCAFDIWSLGITILEMVNGEPPNADSKLRAMYCTSMGLTKPELKNPQAFSNNLLLFLQECLQVDPTMRPTAEDLLQHPWLENVCRRDVMKELITKVFLKAELTNMGF